MENNQLQKINQKKIP